MLKEIEEEVVRGCAVAEAVLQLPQSRAVLPFIVLEHSATLPSQAASWQAALKVHPYSGTCYSGSGISLATAGSQDSAEASGTLIHNNLFA